jgi:exosortase C (VPDSG-CTERM-specific)
MKPTPENSAKRTVLADASLAGLNGGGDVTKRRVRQFAILAVVLSVAFILPLANLARFAYGSDLFSYILLVPLISAYLIWRKRRQFPAQVASSTALAGLALAVGLTALGCWLAMNTRSLLLVDRLCLQTIAFLCFLLAGAFYLLGREALRPFTFPVAFLVFMVPFPTCMTHGLEIFLQHASAEAGALLFAMTGTTVSRHGLSFQLTGIVVEVAQECSGIHSTVVLFITSLLGGYMLLQSKVSRAVLSLVVLPLAIVRNGFRIYILAALASAVDPAIMQSPLHRQGGPLFFLMSLVPFLALLWLLIKLERRKRN